MEDKNLGAFTQVTVGADIAVVTSMSLSGDDASNYSLVQPTGLTANISLIAGDADVDGTITNPEIAGDIDCDGTITFPEIAGDLNGDGEITRPTEIAGDTDGDGAITHPTEAAGDTDGDGQITFPELDGDNNGNGVIEGDEGVTTSISERAKYSLEILTGKEKGSINIRASEATNNVKVSVYSLTGQLIFNDIVSLNAGDNTVDVNSISKTLYIINVEGNKGNTSKKILIK